jgi:hypothetical protein
MAKRSRNLSTSIMWTVDECRRPPSQDAGKWNIAVFSTLFILVQPQGT